MYIEHIIACRKYIFLSLFKIQSGCSEQQVERERVFSIQGVHFLRSLKEYIFYYINFSEAARNFFRIR